MKPRTRRIVQALLYESIAVAIVTPTLGWLFGAAPGSSFVLTVLMSAVALIWNYGFNTVFERWEARQASRERTALRRFVHGAGFEIGLACVLVPMMAWWLGISLYAALIADLGMMLFFFCYTLVFTWSFDRIFGLPQT